MNCAKKSAACKVKRFVDVSTAQVYSSDKVCASSCIWQYSENYSIIQYSLFRHYMTPKNQYICTRELRMWEICNLKLQILPGNPENLKLWGIIDREISRPLPTIRLRYLAMHLYCKQHSAVVFTLVCFSNDTTLIRKFCWEHGSSSISYLSYAK